MLTRGRATLGTMDDQLSVMAIAAGGIVPVLFVAYTLGARRERVRRAAWRRAAARAGIRPELGPWVVGRVAGTWLEAGDHEVGSSRSGYTHESRLRAPIFAALPEALVVSTREHDPGIVRERLKAGAHVVYVRSVDESAVPSFLAGGMRTALGAFFAAVPDAVIEGRPLWAPSGFGSVFLGNVAPDIDWERVNGEVRVRHATRIGAAAIEREVDAFVHLLEALHSAKYGYR